MTHTARVEVLLLSKCRATPCVSSEIGYVITRKLHKQGLIFSVLPYQGSQKYYRHRCARGHPISQESNQTWSGGSNNFSEIDFEEVSSFKSGRDALEYPKLWSYFLKYNIFPSLTKKMRIGTNIMGKLLLPNGFYFHR